MTKLSEKLAQKIVDKMVNVIPYNVIITDEKGIIIGSGDAERIHKFHSVAGQVLKLKKSVEISHESSVDVRPGVNSPIFFEKSLVGVIGISGDPKVVKPFSELVSVTTELLINQEYALKHQKKEEQEKENYLYELSYLNEEYSEAFIERGLSLGIDVAIPNTAVVINSEKETLKNFKNRLNSFLQKGEYCFMLNPNIVVVFINSNKLSLKNLENYLEKDQCDNIKVGVGLKENVISNSLNQALRALHIGKNLEKNKNIYLYKDLCFISMLTSIKEDYDLKDIIKKLKLEGKQADLLNTLAVYVYNNGEMKITAGVLHIHRNTLNYRLEKIAEISGKDPRNLIELFELFTGYVVSLL